VGDAQLTGPGLQPGPLLTISGEAPARLRKPGQNLRDRLQQPDMSLLMDQPRHGAEDRSLCGGLAAARTVFLQIDAVIDGADPPGFHAAQTADHRVDRIRDRGDVGEAPGQEPVGQHLVPFELAGDHLPGEERLGPVEKCGQRRDDVGVKEGAHHQLRLAEAHHPGQPQGQPGIEAEGLGEHMDGAAEGAESVLQGSPLPHAGDGERIFLPVKQRGELKQL